MATSTTDIGGPYVFVSYAREDRGYVDGLVAHLTAEGIATWNDAEIRTGSSWIRELQDRIDRCAAVVLVMSPSADDSEMIAEEIERARAKHKRIFPLLLSGEPMFGFRSKQYDDVSSGSMPRTSTIRDLRELLVARRRRDDAVRGPRGV